MKNIVPKLSSYLSKMWNKILNLEKRLRVNYLYDLQDARYDADIINEKFETNL